jgi:hypothetical protein
MDVLVHVWVFGMPEEKTNQEQHTLEMLSETIRSVVEYTQIIMCFILYISTDTVTSLNCQGVTVSFNNRSVLKLR